jgi:DinB superfamily
MSPKERSEIVQALEDSRAEFHAAAEGTSEAQARLSPAPDRWSVLNCVEHIVIAEGRFLGWLQNPEAQPAPPVDKHREAMLASGVASRATRAQAPAPVQPTGRFSTLVEALDQFASARARSIQFAEERGADLYSLAARHPFFGPLNGAEVMLLMAAHSRRHAAQIREVRSALS